MTTVFSKDGGLDGLWRWACAEEQLSHLRHDLRNKIASVRNANHYLTKRAQGSDLWTKDPRVPTFFGIVEEQLVAAEGMLGQHATLAAWVPPPGSPASLEECVERALAAVQLPASVRLETRIDTTEHAPKLPLLEGALLVACLVANGVEAMEPGGGGQVRVRVESTPGRAGTRLVVEDSGPGLTEDLMNAATRAFYSTKTAPHLGLGLNVVSRLALRHRASLALRSAEAANGLAAVITFPVLLEASGA